MGSMRFLAGWVSRSWPTAVAVLWIHPVAVRYVPGTWRVIALALSLWCMDAAPSLGTFAGPPVKRGVGLRDRLEIRTRRNYGRSPYIVAGDAPSSAFGVSVALRRGLPTELGSLCGVSR